MLLPLQLLSFLGSTLQEPPVQSPPAQIERTTIDPEVVQEPAVQEVAETVISGRAGDLVGVADSASQGTTGHVDLERRPLLRPGELVETVPGMVITQHSGAGKANQFFLRGFNLDHGTDFLTRWNGIPLNLRSHGHGQGYTDLNFLIPELVERIDYSKGPYDAGNGDFASAGSADIQYFRKLPQSLAVLEGGGDGYARALVADSRRIGSADVLYALETYHNDGPWENPDDYVRLNGIVRASFGDESAGSTFTLQGYDGDWTGTDQVAKRAVDEGLIDRFGTLDPTSGGDTKRFTLAAEMHRIDSKSADRLLAYGYRYSLDLFSNFTYALEDPVNGDQFEQSDDRTVFGLDASHTWFGGPFDPDGETTVGIQIQRDDITNGLFRTREREVLSTTREDDIVESSAAIHAENLTQWSDQFRTIAGVRGDLYDFDVSSDDPDNSGSDTASIASPKLSLVFGPWSETELYASGGLGFHSNDARGVTTTDDPSTPEAGDGTPVDPLVRTKGAEIGVRTSSIPGLQSTLSLFVLDIDSELLFIGDAGNTEASRPSRRTGVEWTNFYEPIESLTLDLDASLSHARFRDEAPEGDDIPGAIESAVSAGITYEAESGWFTSLRMRYFGPRPLLEDGSVESSSSTLFNARAGYRINENLAIRLDVLNLFDRKVNDIEYYYSSLLPGEDPGPDDGGYNDFHFHPAEPFTLRLSFIATF